MGNTRTTMGCLESLGILLVVAILCALAAWGHLLPWQ